MENTHKEYKYNNVVFDSERTSFIANFNVGYFEDVTDELTKETTQRFVRTTIADCQIKEYSDIRDSLDTLLSHQLDFHLILHGIDPASLIALNEVKAENKIAERGFDAKSLSVVDAVKVTEMLAVKPVEEDLVKPMIRK